MFGSRARALAKRVATLEAAAGGASLAPPPPPTAATAADLGGGPVPWWFGGGATRAQAMAVPTLAFIRAQLAGGVASMPLERYRTAADGTVTKLDPGWCANPDISPAISPSLFWSWVIDDLFHNGKSTLIVLARDATGYPVAFRRVLPGQITYDPETLAWGTFWPAEIWYLGVRIPGDDIKVINGPHEGICTYGTQTILAALDLETAAANAAAEPLPNIELHQTGGEPLSQTAATDLVTSWKTARQQGATAYTPSNLEARSIGFSSADQQLIEARQYMATQLARLAGVNPVLVSAAMGSSSSYVYTNQADYRAAFLDDVLDAYLRAIEGRLSQNDITPRGQYLEFDRDEFTRLPLLERVQVMVGALKGAATPAIVRSLAEVLDLDFALQIGPEDLALPAETTPPPPPSSAPTPPPPGG